MRYWVYIFLILTGYTSLNNHFIYAKETNAVVSLYDKTNIITETETNSGQSILTLALRIQLKEGWHTYWKNPGEAGEATSVTVQDQDNQQDLPVKIEWPVPERLFENGLMSYIYRGDVVLPLEVALGKGNINKALRLKIKAHWLICKEVCIPEEGVFDLYLPKSSLILSKEAFLIQNALIKRPKEVKWQVNITSQGNLWVKVADIQGQGIDQAWFMPEKSGIIDQDKEQYLHITSGFFQLDLPLLSNVGLKVPISGILALHYKNQMTSYWFIHPRIENLPASHTMNFLFIVGAAFLGGLLLNCMPCVFPVVSMKLLALSRLSQKDQTHRVKSSVAYTAGILCCFIGIAGLLILFRWTGAQIGWGFQFQSLLFLIGLCWLLFLIALNFLGVFSIQVSFVLKGQSQPISYSSDFFSGLLAVLIATPCTAPFMGIALVAALNASLIICFSIFIIMGLGLAFPYLLLALVPVLTRFLPKSGAWMDILRQLLAFPLFLSCLWLVWIIDQYHNSLFVLSVLLGCILVGLMAWLWNIRQQMQVNSINKYFQNIILISNICILGILAGICATVYVMEKQLVGTETVKSVPFSTIELDKLEREHKPVFINMTASWCLTCLVNEKIALSSSKVQEVFRKSNITYMVGDWTHYDDNIRHFLKDYDREGVPLYVFISDTGKIEILPQLLTPQLILKSLTSVK